MCHARTRSILASDLALLALVLLPAAAVAQRGADGSGPVWVQTLDGSPPGSPVEVTFLADDSDERFTFVEIRVPGFWQEDVVGGDGVTYQRLSFPGLQSMGQVGGPEVPSVRLAIAVPTDAGQVDFLGVDEWVVQTFPSLHLHPTPMPGEDEELDPSEDPGAGDANGSSETFAINASIYASSGAYPPDPVAGDPTTSIYYGAIKGTNLLVNPVTWNPATDTLRVAAYAQYAFLHDGQVGTQLQISKHKGNLAAATFVNWEAVQDEGWSLSFVEAHSRYAIVANAMFDAALVPFIEHKKALGFDVTVIHHDVGASRAEILPDVAAWYQAGDPGEDHYLLIVGDTMHVPLGSYTPLDGDPVPTDDDFGTPTDGDFPKEILVGRLSVDDPADLASQIQKIIGYETAPVPAGRYDRALLVAHKEGAPAKYQGAHEDVRTASYAVPPVFVTKYGSSLGPTDFQVQTEIDQGVGVVAYRGHGSTNAWTGWNAFDESFHKNEVLGLANAVHPVVWAVTCTNGNIGTLGGGAVDCITETWMEVATTGAAASYGATVTTSTTPNHELDRRLFQAVYDEGITVHGQAIAWAEQHVEQIWPGHKNPWAYLLLGDPSMKIRREQPEPLVYNLPTFLAPCEDTGCDQTVDVTVLQDGEAVAGALVSLYKPSPDPSQPDEIFVNRYTDQHGQASLPVTITSPGTLHVGVQDEDGNVSVDAIDVVMGPAWQTLGTGVPGVNGPMSLVGVGTLQGGTFVTTILTNARPNAFATLVLGVGLLGAPFKGGTMYPTLDVLIFGIPTGPHGVIDLPATWPLGVPSGLEFYEQYWMADPAAPVGFSSSNALVGTAP